MKLVILILTFCAISTATDEVFDGTYSKEPIVRTQLGSIKGVIQTTLFGREIYSFLKIPYTEPPVGDLRFKPPVPVKKWEQVYDGTKDGPACPQPNFKPISEDCLFLNVYTPKAMVTDQKESVTIMHKKYEILVTKTSVNFIGPGLYLFQLVKLLQLPKNGSHLNFPVIVYIHPGSVTTLTGNNAYAGPQYLLDKDLVLVTFNYRLASLGFLSTGDEHAPGNNGYKDQVEAMRWVKNHISAFGGNPNSILLAGYSAGGLSASLHLVSPMSRGLFNKVLIMSGGALGNVIEKSHQFELAQRQARIVGCPDDTSANIINCLKTIPAETLGNTLESFRDFGHDPQFIWCPIIERDFGQERFLVENPLTSVQCGNVVDVPVMSGVTSDELIFLAQTVVENSTGLEILNRDWNKIAPIAFYYDPNAPNVDEISAELKSFYFGNKSVNSNSLVPLGKLYSDSLAGFGVNGGVELLTRYLRSNVYYYAFTYKGRFSNYNPPGGIDKYTVHFDDMLYVFWNSLQFPLFNKTDPEANIVKKLTGLWYNFAKYGNPIPRRSSEFDWVRWKSYSTFGKEYLDIGESLKLRRNLYPERYEKWHQLFPLQRQECH